MAFKRPSVQFCPPPPDFHEGPYVKVRAFFFFGTVRFAALAICMILGLLE